MAKRPSVPKFGTWEGDNVGYTVYFDKVRENKGNTAPPLHRPFNPNDPADNPGMISGGSSPPSARPATSSGHRESQRRQAPNAHQHGRTGSNSSVSSDPGGVQSKFAPPPQYRPSPSPQHGQHDHVYGHGHGHHPPPAGYNGGGGGGRRAPSPQAQAPRHQQVAPKARSASASPQKNMPNRQRPSAVPKFGVWDEQNGAAAAQGFTVQFDNVKRSREAAKGAGPAGVVPRSPPPEISVAAAKHSRDQSLMSKMFGCFQPSTRD